MAPATTQGVCGGEAWDVGVQGVPAAWQGCEVLLQLIPTREVKLHMGQR